MVDVTKIIITFGTNKYHLVVLSKSSSSNIYKKETVIANTINKTCHKNSFADDNFFAVRDYSYKAFFSVSNQKRLFGSVIELTEPISYRHAATRGQIKIIAVPHERCTCVCVFSRNYQVLYRNAAMLISVISCPIIPCAVIFCNVP